MPAKNASSLAFGRAVNTLRRRQNLSQEQAGLTCGVGRGFFGRLERGEQSPTYDTIIKLADGFEISPAELVSLAERYRLEQPDTGRNPSTDGSP